MAKTLPKENNQETPPENNKSSKKLKTKGKGYNYKINQAKAIELRLKGLSWEDIGRHFETSGSAVKQLIGDLVSTDGVDLKAFKDHRADILAAKGLRLLKSLSEDEIKKIPPGSRLTGFGILYDKERLERGETTENIGYADYTKNLTDLRGEREKLEAELGGVVGVDCEEIGENRDE